MVTYRKILCYLAAAATLSGCFSPLDHVTDPELEVFLDAPSVYVDEPVNFRFEGSADIISFWSGEQGGDYAWRETDRIYSGEGKLSFGTAFMNGQQWKNQASADPDTKLLTLWWSDDFGGDYTPAGVAAAHWHDATALFTFASTRVDDARNLANATASGQVSLENLLPAGNKGPFWFAFRYHLKPIVDAATDSRSRAVVSGFAIKSVNEALHADEAVVTHSSAGWTFVNIGYTDADRDYMPENSASYIYFNASTANTAERWSWAVSKAYTPDFSINLGCDHAVGIKAFSDSPMKGYTYTYSEPGEYDAVFESRNVAADGTVRTKVQHVAVHVSARGGGSIDAPVVFSAGPGEGSTRAAFSDDLTALSWVRGDRMGIFAAGGSDQAGLNYPYEATSIAGATATLSAVSSQWQYARGAVAGCTFRAYAPFSGTAGEGSPFVVPVSVPSRQEQAAAGDPAHLSDYLVLKSFPATADAATGTVNLRFRNLTAVLEVDVRASAASGFRIASARLGAASPLAFDKGNMLLEGDPDDTGGSFQINEPRDTVDLALGTAFPLTTAGGKLYFTVIPGTHAASSLRLKLFTDNDYAAEVVIPDALTFQGNGVYRRSVTVDPSAFKPASGGGETYLWKKITTAAEVTAGEYVVAFDYDYNSTTARFLLPCAAVDRNPVPADAAALALAFDASGNLLSAPAGYVWTVAAATGGWTLSCTAGTSVYKLAGCDQAQGIAVSTDGGGYYTGSKTYSDIWQFTDESTGLQLINSIVPTRKAVPWIDTANGLDHFEWRMAKSLVGGYVLYKKTLAE